jgi:peptide/nickel transport system ATP-binding protein
VTRVYRSRGHEPVTAVDDVSFTLEPGASVGLVGASGSGKSTIAKLVTASERPTSGSVTFGDVRVDRLHGRALRRFHGNVQMVFQDPYGALNPLHTVEYTVSRPCQNYLGMNARQARDRVHELLDTVGLTPTVQYAAKLPHQLSGGQRQRVGLARALAVEPPILLMDEPFGALDPITRSELQREFQALQQRLKKTIVFVTHDVGEALMLGDRIGLMDSGRLRGVYTPAEFWQSKDELAQSYRQVVEAARLRLGG